MTASAPDLPDWTGGQAAVAVDVALTGGIGSGAMPLTVSLTDLGPFSSLFVGLATTNITGVRPVKMIVNWHLGSGLFTGGVYVFPGGSTNPVINGGGTILLPVLGDAVDIFFVSDASGTQVVTYSISGSTRQIAVPSMSGGVGASQDALAIRPTATMAAGAVENYYFGPVGKGVFVNLSTNAVTTLLRIFVYSLTTGTWTGIRSGEMIGSTTADVTATFPIPNSFIQLQLANTGATASSTALYVCGLT